MNASAPIEDVTPDTNRRSSRAVKRESRLTFGGFVYVAVTMFLAIGAINSQNNLLFWLFGVSIATLIVSGIFSGNALMRIRVHARALPEVSAGQNTQLHYIVSNRSRFFPLFACLMSESHKDSKSLGAFTPASLLHLGPGQTSTITGTLCPSKRGRVTLRTLRLTTRFPFGLLQKSLIFEQPRTLLVLPYQLRIRSELITPQTAHGEQIRRRSHRGGKSTEFWGLREYRPGDPRRKIAWKLSARRNGLVVVEHAQTVSTRIWVLLIEPDGAGIEAEILAERGIAVAAALLEQGTLRNIPVGLWYPQRSLKVDPATGRAHYGRMLRALAMVDRATDSMPVVPPPLRSRDQIIQVSEGDRPAVAMRPSRMIDLTRPESWLIDPAALPRALGGAS